MNSFFKFFLALLGVAVSALAWLWRIEAIPFVIAAPLILLLLSVAALCGGAVWRNYRDRHGPGVFTLLRRCMGMTLLLPLLLLFASPRLDAASLFQGQPVRAVNCLSNIVTIGNTVVSNLPASLIAPVRLTPGKPVAIYPYFAGAQATNTGVMGFLFDVSYDRGSTWTTTQPIRITSTGQGAQATRDYVLIPETTLNGATDLKIVTITNAVAQKITTTLTNVVAVIP